MLSPIYSLACMKRPRSAQIGLAVLTTLVCLVAIDRLVLVMLPLGNIVYRAHPDRLYEYIPDSSRFFIHSEENGGDWILVEINEHGQRGEELQARGSAPRIVVYGDSFVAAEFSPLEQTWRIFPLSSPMESCWQSTSRTTSVIWFETSSIGSLRRES
jgi:hypothetical protein